MPYGQIAENRSENIVPWGTALTTYWKARKAFEACADRPGDPELCEHADFLAWTLDLMVHARNAELTPETAKMRPIKRDLGDLMTIEEFEEGVQCHALTDYDGGGDYATSTHVSDLSIRPSHLMWGFVYPGWTHILWYNK